MIVFTCKCACFIKKREGGGGWDQAVTFDSCDRDGIDVQTELKIVHFGSRTSYTAYIVKNSETEKVINTTQC